MANNQATPHSVTNSVYSLDVPLPANLDAERMILGVILLDNRVAPAAFETLATSDFFGANHKLIYAAMRKMWGRQAIDALTLKAELDKAGPHACDLAFIASLFDGVPRLSDISSYVALVKEKAILRHAIKLGNWMITVAADPTTEAESFLPDIQRRIESLMESRQVDDLISSEQAVDRTLTMLQQQWDSGNRLLGMSTGIHALDHRLSGIRRGKYITIAGTPGMGKTTLMLNMVNSFDQSAEDCNARPVGLIITLEMSVEELKVKLCAARTGTSTDRIETGHMSEAERRTVRQTMAHLAELNIEYVEGYAKITATSIMARVDRVRRKHGGRIDYLALDYIQLVDGEDDAGNETENAKLTEISRTLKRIATRYQIPVIVLSQLNRQWAARSNKDPELTDIRGSGSIVQDSDIVIFIAPQDYSDPENCLRKLLTRKFRGGRTGTDMVLFSGARSQFMNIEDQRPPESQAPYPSLYESEPQQSDS